MSFFGSFFNAAMKEMEKNQNKYERANEKAANMSDEQLRRKFESSTNTFEKWDMLKNGKIGMEINGYLSAVWVYITKGTFKISLF